MRRSTDFQAMPPSDQPGRQRSDRAWLADRTAGYLREWERRYRKCWRHVGELRGYYARKAPNEVPSWCWIPTEAVLHLYTPESAWGLIERVREFGIAGSTELVALTALAAWRQTKGVYQFDPDLAREVITTDLDDKLPAQALKRLPAWCCYVASGEAIPQAAGFFVFLDWLVLAHRHRGELVFVFDLDTAGEQGLVMDWSIPLLEGESIRQAISRAMDNTRDYPDRIGRLAGTLDAARLLADFIYPAVDLTLYLCAGNPDIVPGTPQDPASPSRRKRRSGGIPSEPRAWEVGWRIGATLRAARDPVAGTQRRLTTTGRASPRPHIRGAHWQSFRTGPGRPNERSDYVVHWIPPVPVNVDPSRPDGGLVTTIRPVRDDPGGGERR